jgi:hypothetical protein
MYRFELKLNIPKHNKMSESTAEYAVARGPTMRDVPKWLEIFQIFRRTYPICMLWRDCQFRALLT